MIVTEMLFIAANVYSNHLHSFMQQRLGLLRQEVEFAINRIIEMEDEIKGALYEEKGKRLDKRVIQYAVRRF